MTHDYILFPVKGEPFGISAADWVNRDDNHGDYRYCTQTTTWFCRHSYYWKVVPYDDVPIAYKIEILVI